MSGYQNEKQRQEVLLQPKLVIHVHEARGLKVAHHFSGTSSPYVEMRIEHATESFKTQVIKKSLNPFWNEDFVIHPKDIEKDVLIIKIYDYTEVTSHELLGEVEIFVIGLKNVPVIDKWYSLVHRTSPSSTKPMPGELKMSIALELPQTTTIVSPAPSPFAPQFNQHQQVQQVQQVVQPQLVQPIQYVQPVIQPVMQPQYVQPVMQPQYVQPQYQQPQYVQPQYQQQQFVQPMQQPQYQPQYQQYPQQQQQQYPSVQPVNVQIQLPNPNYQQYGYQQ